MKNSECYEVHSFIRRLVGIVANKRLALRDVHYVYCTVPVVQPHRNFSRTYSLSAVVFCGITRKYCWQTSADLVYSVYRYNNGLYSQR